MNIREIIEIRDKLKNDLNIVEKFLEIAKRQGLANGDSIDNQLALSTEGQSLLKPVVKQSGNGYGAIGKSIFESIKLCPIEFTVTDVRESLKEIDPNVSKLQIATVLSRFSRQKKIQVISRKVGRKAAIYRRM